MQESNLNKTIACLQLDVGFLFDLNYAHPTLSSQYFAHCNAFQGLKVWCVD